MKSSKSPSKTVKIQTPPTNVVSVTAGEGNTEGDGS